MAIELEDPVTRSEKYLFSIATSGDTSDLPQPVTRSEKYLYEIAVNGGGGGGDFPEAPQDGKAYARRNAAWVKNIDSGDALPASGYEGQMFALVADSGESKKGIYRFDGSEWGMVAGADESKFLSVERLGAYIYKATFDAIPDYEEVDTAVGGGCSSFVKDGKLYRNLDWNYDNTAEFWVVTKDFEGMAFLPGVNDGEIDYEKVEQLPYHVNDGVNRDGIMVSSHVLFNDWSFVGSGAKNKPLTLLPYFILANVHSMAELSTAVSDYLANIKVGETLASLEYLMQFVVTDGTTTKVILPPTAASGTYSVVDATANPKLTNFRWVAEKTVSRADLQDRPTGVERWNAIDNLTDGLAELRFTKAYEAPTRLSEFIGEGGTTKASTDAELEAIYDIAHAKYLTRTRNGELWQTCHSVVYGESGMESLCVQEDFEKDYILTEPDDYLRSIEKNLTNKKITITDKDGNETEFDYGIKEILKTEVDAMEITETGFYRLEDCSGLPTGISSGELMVIRSNDSGSSIMQIYSFTDENDSHIYFRGSHYDEFFDWSEIGTDTEKLKIVSKYYESLSGNADTQYDVNAELVSAIKFIQSKPDVADIVQCYDRGTDATKTDIAHYDLTTLLVNDIVKVLIDETHDGKVSYYKVVQSGSAKSFSYLGSDKPVDVDGTSISKNASGQLEVLPIKRAMWDEAYSKRAYNNTGANYTTREQLIAACVNGANFFLTRFTNATENPDGVSSSQMWNIVVYRENVASCQMWAYKPASDEVYKCYRQSSGWTHWVKQSNDSKFITLSGESGTLTTEQLSILNENDDNYIKSTSGYIFRCVGTGTNKMYALQLNEDTGEEGQDRVRFSYILVNATTGAWELCDTRADVDGYKAGMKGTIANENTGYVEGGEIYAEFQKKENKTAEIILSGTSGTLTPAQLSQVVNNPYSTAIVISEDRYRYVFKNSPYLYFARTMQTSSSYVAVHSTNGTWTKYAYSLEQTSNKITSLSSSATNTQYLGAKVVYDEFQKKANITNNLGTVSREDIFDSFGTTSAGNWIIGANIWSSASESPDGSTSAYFTTIFILGGSGLAATIISSRTSTGKTYITHRTAADTWTDWVEITNKVANNTDTYASMTRGKIWDLMTESKGTRVFNDIRFVEEALPIGSNTNNAHQVVVYKFDSTHGHIITINAANGNICRSRYSGSWYNWEIINTSELTNQNGNLVLPDGVTANSAKYYIKNGICTIVLRDVKSTTAGTKNLTFPDGSGINIPQIVIFNLGVWAQNGKNAQGLAYTNYAQVNFTEANTQYGGCFSFPVNVS